MTPGTYDVSHFVEAQRETWDMALAELIAGRKRTHWMWFIFPQLSGLSSSSTAMHFGLRDLDHARAYLAHPLLGSRLRLGVTALLPHAGRPVSEILGYPDDLKLCSCLTLFLRSAETEGDHKLFREALRLFYESEEDQMTHRLLG